MLLEDLKIRWIYQGRKTTCNVSTVSNELVAETSVTRYIKDSDNKRLARKLAFVGVMRNITQNKLLPKTTRTTIWNAFREKINQPVPAR